MLSGLEADGRAPETEKAVNPRLKKKKKKRPGGKKGLTSKTLAVMAEWKNSGDC